MEEAPPPGHGRRILANAEAGTVNGPRTAQDQPVNGVHPRPSLMVNIVSCLSDIYITDTVYVVITRHYQRHGAVCAHVVTGSQHTLGLLGHLFLRSVHPLVDLARARSVRRVAHPWIEALGCALMVRHLA